MIFLALLVLLVLPSLPPTKKPRVHIAEGFLCQMKERVRSLLCVGEELAP